HLGTPLFRLVDNTDKIEFLETPFPELFGVRTKNSVKKSHPQLEAELKKILSENANLDSTQEIPAPPYKLKITKRPSARSGKGLRSKNVLAAPPGTSFSVSMENIQEYSLSFGYGIVNESWENIQGGVKFEIFVEDKDTDSEESIFNQILNPKKKNIDRRWLEFEINLASYTGQSINLIFKTSPTKQNKAKNNCVSVWENPTLIRKEAKHPHPNIILISIDTLRADHLGCYGYNRNTTPHIDLFSSSAVLFKNVIAQAPYTVSSHMSMLTSLYPSFHKVNMIELSRLNPDKKTLTEILYNHGYRTWAITGGGQVSSGHGFFDGFETFIEYTAPHRDVERKVRETINFLKKEKGNTFFVFFHTYKPHAPYMPIPPYDTMFDEDYKGQITGRLSDINDINSGKIEVNQADVEHIVSLYDGEIREMDDQLAVLFDYLKQEGLMEKTLIVFTSDHGEEFNEHGSVGVHSHTLYDELLRVPLILRMPEAHPEQAVIEDQIQSIDIFPTILQIAGIPYPDNSSQGTSVVPLIEGRKLNREPNIAFSERTPSDGLFLRALRDSSQKYIFEEDKKKGSSKHSFFDLKNDPREQLNINIPNKKLRSLFAEIQFLIEEGKKVDQIVKKKKIDPETLETLKALGYIE
ncbi:sulfatase, partial [Acidobacteriota bacterium]